MRAVHILAGVLSIFGKSTYSEKIYTSYTPLRLQSSAQCAESDYKLWTGSQSNQFYNNIRSCTVQNTASTDITNGVSECLQNIYPDLSPGCAQCFGEDVDCGATNCRVPCQEASSTSCQICLQPCTQTLVSCAGTTNLPADTTRDSSSKSADMKFTHLGSLIISSIVFLIFV